MLGVVGRTRCGLANEIANRPVVVFELFRGILPMHRTDGRRLIQRLLRFQSGHQVVERRCKLGTTRSNLRRSRSGHHLNRW